MNTPIFHITLYNLAFLGAAFIGLSFALQLWFAKPCGRAASRFLSLALVVMVLWLLRLLGRDMGVETAFPGWGRVPLQFSLAFGPLIYFFVLKLTRTDHRLRLKDLLHFGPLLLQLGMHALVIAESLKTAVATYQTAIFDQLNAALYLLTFVSVVIYIYLSLRLTDRFYKRQKFNGGDRYRRALRWLSSLLRGFGVLWLLLIPFTAVDYFYYHYQLNIHVYYPLYILLSAIIIWIGAATLSKRVGSVPAATASFIKPPLPAGLKQNAAWLKKTMQAGLHHRDPQLSLGLLAQRLGIGSHELSRIINTALKKSFNDFINELRVADVVNKMQDPGFDHITLLGIAFESGFSSKTTFNRAFKQFTGKSPVEYKNDLKKERPSYNLGRHPRAAALIWPDETNTVWLRQQINRNCMFKNYFKIARRNLLRNKGYAAINIAGLAVGIAVCVLIFIIVRYHTSFDNFHPKKDRIYRVLTEYHPADAGAVSYGKSVPFPMPAGLKTAFPQLEQVAPVYASHNDVLQVLDANGAPVKNFKEQSGVFYTGPSFFSIFNFPLLAGSYASLKDPNNVLLTKEIAETYFGDWKTAMGKTIKLTGSYSIGAGLFQSPPVSLKVSGILATIPANTDFQFKLVIAYGTDFTGDSMYGFQQIDWNQTSADFGCYVLLPPNISADNFDQQLRAYSRTVLPADNKDSHVLQSLSAVHYDTQTGNYSNKTISKELLNVLWLIAAFILLIACVNFINLSTAQAVNRAKEVGVRKVLGSSKSQLQVQFIIETFLIVASAMLLAGVATVLAIPYVNRLLELSLSFNIFGNITIILFLLTVTIVVTALAGFYPSVVLSRFNPVNALKSKLTVTTASGISLRRGLVVVQFVIAQALIIGTLVIVKQMDYFMHQPLGFDKDAIVNVPFRPDSTGSRLAGYLTHQLLQVNGVQAVSFSSNTPVEDDNNRFTTLKFDHAVKKESFEAIVKFADENYVPTYKLQLVAGRNLQHLDMTREFLVNESFVKSLGLKNPEDILNKEVSIWGDVIKCPVVGVVKDFNDRSLRNNLAPLLIATNITMYRQAAIKLSTTNISSTMQSVKKVWEQTFPDYVYDYQFLDDKIASFYKQENQLAALYKIFASVAICLSCLGLYGLASFMAVQRVKEVGIRKILGASAGSIVYLFSKEFIILIALAFTVAAPIAWYCMHQWLQDFVYRIHISWWLFAAGGLGAIIIALATISFQAIKAALANPVKSLRSE